MLKPITENVSEQTIQIELSHTYSQNSPIVFPTLPFQPTPHTDLNNTISFQSSQSDTGIEFSKTTEEISQFLKNKIISAVKLARQNVGVNNENIHLVLGLSQERLIDYRTDNEFLPLHSFRDWVYSVQEAADLEIFPIFDSPFKFIPSDPIEELYDKLSKEFKISNWPDFKNFIKKIMLTQPTFSSRILSISEEVQNYLKLNGIDAISSLEKEIDFEDEYLENLKLTLTIKQANAVKCFQISKDLITHLAKIDKKILEFLHIQVQPE